LEWFEQDLAPLLQPYPHPRSLVVIDNLLEHRSHAQQISNAITSQGARLLFNPPRSPDLNPIEKLWDVCNAHTQRKMSELACGYHGAPRRFYFGDLVNSLQDARLSLLSNLF
jgi:DDE superfamily endonuclease